MRQGDEGFYWLIHTQGAGAPREIAVWGYFVFVRIFALNKCPFQLSHWPPVYTTTFELVCGSVRGQWESRLEQWVTVEYAQATELDVSCYVALHFRAENCKSINLKNPFLFLITRVFNLFLFRQFLFCFLIGRLF